MCFKLISFLWKRKNKKCDIWIGKDRRDEKLQFRIDFKYLTSGKLTRQERIQHQLGTSHWHSLVSSW